MALLGSDARMSLAERGWMRAKLRAMADWTRGDQEKLPRMGEAARGSNRDSMRGPPKKLRCA